MPTLASTATSEPKTSIGRPICERDEEESAIGARNRHRIAIGNFSLTTEG
jgi:hypothetical protein